MAGRSGDGFTISGAPGAAAFYRREAGRFVPTGLGISPWRPDAQVGVALAGLAAHVLDAVPAPAPMTVARLTIDILGAVPLVPLVAATRVVREGRRVQLLETRLADAEARPWLCATMLRVRTAASPAQAAPPTRAFAAPPTGAEPGRWAEVVRVEGSQFTPGPGAAWVRIGADLVEGEPLAPLERAAMVADFGSGIAPPAAWREWTFANVDVALHLTRLPAGEWLLVDATSEGAGTGFAVAHARLGDRDGMIGVAHQTAFLQPR